MAYAYDVQIQKAHVKHIPWYHNLFANLNFFLLLLSVQIT